MYGIIYLHEWPKIYGKLVGKYTNPVDVYRIYTWILQSGLKIEPPKNKKQTFWGLKFDTLNGGSNICISPEHLLFLKMLQKSSKTNICLWFRKFP